VLQLYLRDPRKSFGLPLTKTLSWKDIQEVVRKRGQTAIGFTKSAPHEHLLLGHQAEVHLAVPAESQITLAPGDKLVVIALQ
jgi:hypothetical protein